MRRTLPASRLITGPALGLVLPFALTFLLDHTRGSLDRTREALLFLPAVVGVACVGCVGCVGGG
ncbi:hypothetical protein [Streptomyces sp. NBC_01310]|uniref:hypothetical protein n=1 Tax=Streptomyces sp. NBC_01310 TaxID=2903820 RepID=UPI0035B6823D